MIEIMKDDYLASRLVAVATKTVEDYEASHNNINHPNHYTNGEIETIDYIRDKLSIVEFIGYCIGNVLKYVSRWRLKGGVEDLEKAAVYLNWAIERAKDGNKDAA